MTDNELVTRWTAAAAECTERDQPATVLHIRADELARLCELARAGQRTSADALVGSVLLGSIPIGTDWPLHEAEKKTCTVKIRYQAHNDDEDEWVDGYIDFGPFTVEDTP